MDGRIKKIVSEKQYGFIQTDRSDYFFHKEDFDGDWKDLCKQFEAGAEIEVTFEPSRTDKGLRAREVSEK